MDWTNYQAWMEKARFCNTFCIFSPFRLLPGNSAIENVTFLGWWICVTRTQGVAIVTSNLWGWSLVTSGSSPGKACLPRLLFQFLTIRCTSVENIFISCMNLFQGTYLYKWSLIRPAIPNCEKKKRSRVATKAGNNFYHVLGMCLLC